MILQIWAWQSGNSRLAGRMVRQTFLFEFRPKSSTGKIKKYKLHSRIRRFASDTGKGPTP